LDLVFRCRALVVVEELALALVAGGVDEGVDDVLQLPSSSSSTSLVVLEPVAVGVIEVGVFGAEVESTRAFFFRGVVAVDDDDDDDDGVVEDLVAGFSASPLVAVVALL
jgi:hypothetical protein